MSTFDGFIKEFPDIQVDYFRSTPATAQCRPLACFLSHVHSDHLVGLDTLRSPFVYCSAATRALVLRLEKYPCRINFAKGILEARKRTYKDLKHLLKPLPLDTPIAIQLSPGNSIQVTLLDANHCPGSVMFLFENEHKAALYTGDTRLEPWFVNALVRNPCLAEYISGLRTLDTVYMDTTFLQKDIVFQTKSEGLCELLQAVHAYPPDTVFYLRAWTFGYEEVWTALSKALASRVHVDAYKMSMYASLVAKDATSRFGSQFHLDPAAPGLAGFMCANTEHSGCLQMENELVRLHSCEKGTGYCSTVRNSPVVWIQPIVCRYPHGHGEMAEVGAGGGGGDLNKDAELEVSSQDDIDRLCQVLANKSERADDDADDKKELRALLNGSLQSSRHIPVHLNVDASQASEDGQDRLGAKTIEDAVRDMIGRRSNASGNNGSCTASGSLSRTITFPYSRHSSYQEQCDLLGKLKPRDVWPCTVHEDTWFRQGEIVTIRDLFGQYCTGDTFRHDEAVAAKHEYIYNKQNDAAYDIQDTQMTGVTVDSDPQCLDMSLPAQCEVIGDDIHKLPATPSTHTNQRPDPSSFDLPYFYHTPSFGLADYLARVEDVHNGQDVRASHDLQASGRDLARERRLMSHQAIVLNAVGGSAWAHIGLSSTSDNHTTLDADLGNG